MNFVSMFLKGITKENKITGERKMRFRLCESYGSGYTVKPFTRKKFVVPPEEISKLQTLIGKDFHPVLLQCGLKQ